eukprot:2834410-Prymnesium_polylepis.2
MHYVPARVFWPADWRSARCGLWCLPELGRAPRVARRVVFCETPQGGRVRPVCTTPFGMNPGGFTPGSGTHLNSLNSTPDDQGRAQFSGAFAGSRMQLHADPACKP